MEELEEDMPLALYKIKEKEFLEGLLSAKDVEKKTVGQSDNSLWAIERRKRLTASNFGRICKMRPKTSVRKTLESLLYNKFKGNAATNYGKEKESEAIDQFTKETGLQIVQCGLYVDENKSFLAASPDGLIGEDSIVEVKCPYKIASLSPQEGIEQKKIDFCTFHDQTLQLKQNHNYFYQVQGQLHITRRDFCYFILWSPKGLLFQKIKRDDVFWEKMEPTLEKFYLQCLLPEIIEKRIPKNRPVRERTSSNHYPKMAKFIKSIFSPEKRKTVYDDELEGEAETPPLDERRKLSMSRSGRLKQSYKRRQQLNAEVYGGEDLHTTERPKSLEYHVNKPTIAHTRKEAKTFTKSHSIEPKIEPTENNTKSEKLNDAKSTDEEIDDAFEIIDKS